MTTKKKDTTSKKALTKAAADVWAGKYGNGQARVTALTKAGYNAGAVQALVNKGVGKATAKTTVKPKTSTKPKTNTKPKAETPVVQPSVEDQEVQDNNNEIQSTLDQFMSNYVSALNQQYEAEQARLGQERANAQVSIMSNANVGGTLYSNLTGRDKVKYDTNTYLPGLQTAYTTYQTGLNDMRAKASELANTLKGYEEQTADTAYQMAQYQKQIEEQIKQEQAKAYGSYLEKAANNTLYKDALKQNPDLKSALPGLS